jgi:ABC-type transport system involved in cytochrome c biogenesis permease subunit
MSIHGHRTPETVGETETEAREREAREAETIELREAEAPHPITAAKDRFGGIDLPASLVGMLTALAVLVLLGGLVGAAIGAIGYQTGLSGDDVEDISIASLVGGLVVLAVAYLIGGWTAGRIARYDGARNGLMTGVWTIVLAGALSVLAAWFGSEYDVLANVELPQWFDRDAVTTTAIVSGVAAIATMLVAGLVGGLWGTRYHRLADQTILDARELSEVEVP